MDWRPVEINGVEGKAPLVLVCEHASNYIPSSLGSLGLSEEALLTHIAWDIGANEVAKRLSATLDAPLVSGAISRLAYDCNRPLEADDCVIYQTESCGVPSNFNLSEEDRKVRYDRIHTPFHNKLDEVLAKQIARSSHPVSLVTIHSFTTVYKNNKRELDIGFIFDEKDSYAARAFDIEAKRKSFRVAINEPYSRADGVTYTLKKHAESRGLKSLMIEVRDELINTPDKAEKMAQHLAYTLRGTVDFMGDPSEKGCK